MIGIMPNSYAIEESSLSMARYILLSKIKTQITSINIAHIYHAYACL